MPTQPAKSRGKKKRMRRDHWEPTRTKLTVAGKWNASKFNSNPESMSPLQT